MASSKLYAKGPIYQGREIRLLEFSADEQDDGGYCRFAKTSLTPSALERATYFVLSYTWGPPPDTKIIWIDGHQVQIRENLWQFLCHWQKTALGEKSVHPSTQKWFWIDALFIDQRNTTERNDQVQMMNVIYSYVREDRVYLSQLQP